VGEAKRPAVGPGHTSGPSWELSGMQRTIFGALNDKHERLGKMYAGALHVLQSDNPDRLAMAAHNLRELIEKLPNHIDVPAAATDDALTQPKGLKTLTVQVRELLDQWNKVANQVDGAAEISPRLKTFLGRLREFSEWFDQNKQKRREQAIATFRKLDPSPRRLPTPIENYRVGMWISYRDFFIAVAHHGKTCSYDEFLEWLSPFEGFLADCLSPRTFDDFTVIDALIEEGNKDA
jgi:hypothetical protein